MASPSTPRRFRGCERAEILGFHVVVARGPLARGLGLALLEREVAGDGLLIPRCSAVHTFGMRFALDLVFLSAAGEVVELRRSVGPRKLASCRAARSVLEIPSP